MKWFTFEKYGIIDGQDKIYVAVVARTFEEIETTRETHVVFVDGTQSQIVEAVGHRIEEFVERERILNLFHAQLVDGRLVEELELEARQSTFRVVVARKSTHSLSLS